MKQGGNAFGSSAEHRQPSLVARAASGAVWSVVGYGGAQVLRLAGNLVLTRILYREAFGVMALVSVFMHGLELFSDIGVGPSIVQDDRGDDPRFLNTAWTMQIGRGLVLWSLAFLGAPLFARFYGEPLLVYMIPAAALASLAAGLASTRLWTATRHLAVARLEMIRLASQAVAVATTIIWAVVSPSAWALVAGWVATSVSRAALSHLALPGHRNRLQWDRSAAAALFRFGRWVFFSTLLTFLATQSDRLIFGKLVSLATLGVYSIGVVLVSVPRMVFQNLTQRIAFPLFSRSASRGEDFEPLFRRARWLFLLAGGWVLSGLIAGGPTAVALLYDDRYYDAGWIAQVLAVGTWFLLLEAANAAGLFAKGRPAGVAAGNATKLVGMLVLLPLGHHWGGFPGSLAGLAAADVLKYGVSTVAAARVGLRAWYQDAAATIVVGAAAISGIAVARLCSRFQLHTTVEAGMVFLAVTAVWLPLALPVARRAKRHGTGALFADQ